MNQLFENFKINPVPIVAQIIAPIPTVVTVLAQSPVKLNKLVITSKYKESSSLYLILLNYFGLDVVEGKEDVVAYIMSIGSLSLLGLFCLINIVIYLTLIYLINKHKESNLIAKYPILQWIIKRYKSMTLGFIIFEFLLLFIILLVLFISSVLLINQRYSA